MTESVSDEGGRWQADFHAIEALQGAAAEAGWDLEYRQLQAGSLTARATIHQFGPLLLDHETVNLGMEVAGTTAPDMVSIAGVIRGQALVNGLPMEGVPVLVPPSVEVVHTSTAGVEAATLLMSATDFDSLFGRRGRRWLESRQVTPLAGLTSDWLQRMVALVDQDPRFLATAANEAARFAEMTGGSSRWPEPSTTAQIVDRAREYIEANLARTIRMPDVCRHAGASMRSLERAFAFVFQMPPSKYIEGRRLDHARRALLDRRNHDRTIATIAYDSGFNHLGRFAGAFRTRFGEIPRDARRRIQTVRG